MNYFQFMGTGKPRPVPEAGNSLFLHPAKGAERGRIR